MTMIGGREGSTARERVRELFRWRSSRQLLVIAAAITVIISLFEIRLDPLAMLREVASNFITCLSITYVTAVLTSAFGMIRLGRDWWRFLLLLVLLAGGGVLGGLLSWGINDLLFPYYISHPPIYLMITGSLAIIFGLAYVTYENVKVNLDLAVARLAEKEILEQKLLRLKTQAELDALHARVHPHFLFNTLNSIASLIPVDPGKAEDMVQRLSNLFHYILSAGDRGLVRLEEELDIVGQYLEIEKVRLGNRLDYRIGRGEGLDGTMVPPLLLQPLVENSVKHGIGPQSEGGKIDITCRRDGGRCVITVVDTGDGFDPQSAGSGFGITGVKQRLELNYPGLHRFDVSADGGSVIRITIPAIDEIQDRTG